MFYSAPGIQPAEPFLNASLQIREQLVLDKVNVYRKTAAIEGGITGAGGLLLGLADFPILALLR